MMRESVCDVLDNGGRDKPVAVMNNPGSNGPRWKICSLKPARCNNLHLVAFALYAVIAFIYFGLPVIGNFNTKYIGVSADPTQFMWSFKWIIYALTHAINPLYTNLIWVPGGYDLSFKTFIPGLSLISIPLTLWLGVVRTYNVWQILNPALGAYFTFVLCYYITKKYAYSLIGGYIFGFSSFEMAQTLVHLQISTIFLIPLMVYLVLLLGDSKLKRIPFVLLLSVALVFQFLFSLEVFTTFTFFGVITALVSYLCVPKPTKALIKRCILPVLISYLFCFVILSPYLYNALLYAPKGAVHDPFYYVNDLLNFIIPTPLVFLGKSFLSISVKFGGNVSKWDSYFGVGLLAIATLFALGNWRKPQGRVLLLAFIIPAVASLGPVVQILGKPSFPSLFYPLAYLPLIKDAQPNRMVVFASLPMAIMVTMWLANSKLTWSKAVLVLLSLLLIFPNFPYPSSATGVPAFISTSEYKKYISNGSNVLVIPYSYRGNGMLWQAETNFYFTMASGYLGPPPARYDNLPIVESFLTGKPSPDLDEAVRSYVYSNDIKDIIVDANLSPAYLSLFRGLGIIPEKIGGVWLYQVSKTVMRGIKEQNLSAEEINYVSPYDQAFLAVKAFLSKSGDMRDLYPQYLERVGLLPTAFGYSVGPTRNWTQSGQWVGRRGESVAIGSEGDSQSMVPIINKYKGIAEKIYFPYPKVYLPGVNAQGQLLMVFTKASVIQSRLP